MKHSLENVVVDNDVEKTQGVEVAIEGKREDGCKQEQHHIHSSQAIDVDGRVGLLGFFEPKPMHSKKV